MGNHLLLIISISLMLHQRAGLAQQITFTNVADSMEINHDYSVGAFYGAGVTFCDFDEDGFEDLSIPSALGEQISLYRNRVDTFENIAPQLHLEEASESKSVLWADYDNDGDKDLFITHMVGKNRLYRNEANEGFADVTAVAGISTEPLPSMGACWGDYDNDGWLDLYVVNYSGVPNFGVMRNYLYRNQGDGTFLDVTLTAGVADSGKHAFIAVFFDYNNDGWQDIYIANDRSSINTLFENMGNGTFIDMSEESNANLDFDAMGIAVGDYNDDGWLDLYVSNGPVGNGLLRNNGDGTFTEIAESLGLTVDKGCWGVNFFDYDNDSDLDLYVCASIGVSPGSADRKNVLFENLGDGTFIETSGIGLDNDNYESYGNAIADFNNDGYCDIAVLNEGNSFSLWENSGGSNNWIKIKLQGISSNRDGIGSIIEVYRDGKKFIRSVHCGMSFMSQNSLIQTIGVGKTTLIDSVIIKWPSGTIDAVRDLPVNRKLLVVEGGSITGIADNVSFPNQITLYANYPNPFNPSTNILFELPKPEKVILKIFNVFGQEVKTLIHQPMHVGKHTISWDGHNQTGEVVSSGVYFYKIQAGDFIATRKMLFIR